MNQFPPSDSELEKYVLACCMVANDVNPDLTGDMFFDNRNKSLFKALCDGHYMPDVIALAKYDIEQEYFFGVLECSSVSFVKEDQIYKLKELSARRSLISLSQQHLSQACDLTIDAKTLPIDLSDGSQIVNKDKLARSVADSWAKSTNIDTGFRALDIAVSGFDLSDVWILAGRSGTKKTSLGMQVLENLCKNEGCQGIFFSIEMYKNQLFKRLAMLHYYDCIDNVWQTEDYEASKEGARLWFNQNKSLELANYLVPRSYSICWKTGLTVSEIASYIRKERKSGKDIKVILIDYMQLMKDPTAKDRRNEVSQIARDLKTMAKNELVKVICLCQLSRAAEDGTIEPKLHHLKESGDIEESADIITGSFKGETDSHTWITPLKNRNDGTNGKFILMTDGVTFRTPHDTELMRWCQ